MPIVYMTFWSTVMVLLFSFWRLRNWSQTLLLTVVTAVVLLFTHTLFLELSYLAGTNPNTVLDVPGEYINRGIYGLLALLVMPFGWLAPVVGLYLAEKLAMTGADHGDPANGTSYHVPG
jgi:hypothetical protein